MPVRGDGLPEKRHMPPFCQTNIWALYTGIGIAKECCAPIRVRNSIYVSELSELLTAALLESHPHLPQTKYLRSALDGVGQR